MSGIGEAQRRIKANADAHELSLDNLGLTTLAPLLPLLGGMPQLTSLDISNNNLTELPASIGSAMPLVAVLNMAGNPIPAVKTVLMGLRSLPALRNLSVDLPLETEEDQLIVALPSLEHFNGTSLVDDGDAEHGGSGSAMPPGPGATAALMAADGDGTRATYWTSADSAAVEGLFASVTEATGEATHPPEFFDYLNRVVKHVTCLTAADEDPLCQEGEVLKARRLLFDYCFEEMVNAVVRKDPAMGKGVAALASFSATLLDGYDTHWRRIFRDRDARLTLMKRDMRDAIRQIESLMMHVGAGAGAGAGAESKAVAVVTDLADADDESDTWGRAGTHSGREPHHHHHHHRGGGEQAGSSGDSPRSRRLGHSVTTPSRAVVAAPKGEVSYVDPTQPQPQLQRHRQPEDGNASEDGDAYQGRALLDASADRWAGARGRTRGADPNYNGKVLTLKQLKDTIDDIYSSKTRYDAKCKKAGLPRETMEQHMYTYLNQRYGLKEIIQDWATAIANGIKRFATADNDVAVFGKILRNDIDEEFRYVQRQVRDTVRELVRAQIKARRPLRSDVEVAAQLEKVMTGMLAEDEWTGVVRYMYNAQDATTLIALVRKTIYQQMMPSRVRRQGRPAAPPTPEESRIPYKDLVHLLLDFQLEGHERFLADYTAIFRSYDRDGNGIVNSEEFKAVVRAMDSDKTEEEIEAMAQLVDPFGSQLITFSETVTFLSNELMKMPRGSAAV